MFLVPREQETLTRRRAGCTLLPHLGMAAVFNSCLVTTTFGHPAASHQVGTKGGEGTAKPGAPPAAPHRCVP